MPKTPMQVEAALNQIKQARDNMDNTNTVQAETWEQAAITARSGGDPGLASNLERKARRLKSVGHDKERANAVEVCIDCELHYDDNGDLVGAAHLRHPVEDTDISPPGHTGPPIMAPGLKSLLRDDRANIDVGGRITIDGRSPRG